MRTPFSRRRFLAALTVALAPRTSRAAAASPLDRYFRRLHESAAFSGAVVVSEKGRVLYQGAFGLADRERGARFRLDSPADGGSLTKTFTAASVLALVAEGRVRLDDPARRHLPELPYDLTVRHLVTHTNGLPDYDWFEPFYRADEVRTNARNLELLREHRPALSLTPGRSFAYGNLGFDLAVLIVERVTGRPFASFLRERFFAPLGISGAFIRPARLQAFRGVRTRGYRQDGAPFDAFDFEGFYGAGNLYASARDLARWNAAWMRRPPLPASVMEEGLRPAPLGEGESGLTLLNLYRSPDGTRFWYHGHHQGFHDTIWRDVARGRSIVFVSNHGIGAELQSGLVPAVVALLDGGAPEPAPAWTPLLDGEDVAGRWTVPGVGEIELERRDGRLSIRHATGVRYALYAVEPRAFYAPGLEAWLGFDRDAAGGIAGLVWRTLMGGARGTRVASPR